jgi:hypothetical protein
MKTVLKKFVGSSIGIALAVMAQAGGLTNNFDSGADFVNNGVIGTMWDGVYLSAGDIPGGTGTGTTIEANETTFPGFLTVQGTVGAWVGNEDDSFFLYKVIAGDFDVSVDVTQPFDSSAYHLPGLLARAYNPNNSGAPYSATDTNSVENWIYVARFQEFSINEHVRYATNGIDINGYIDTAGDDSDTNSDRYLRMTRVGDVFSFYDKTNPGDAWNPIGTLSRPDLDGVAMQVGIKDESGTANTPLTYFTDFELNATNLTTPVMPTAPANLVTTATNITGSLTFSWNTGTPGDSSLVVISQHGIRQNPVQGLTYNSSAGFGDTSALLGGAGEYVVYNGTGNSVTVTNLGANNLTYNVAVYEYTNNGSSIIYNTAAPATNSFAGPGIINAVTLVANATNIPTGGATALQVLADFSTGESNIDQTAVATWSSSAPTIANVNGSGVVSGVASGSATITGNFGNFVVSTNITVHGPFAFADNFSSTHDYVAKGLAGSMYDGLFLNFGDVPGGRAGADGAGSTLTMNSQITDTNGLYISSVQSDWQGSSDDGPFLFKIVSGANNAVSGDFQAVVHINSMNTLNGVVAGLMARLYNPANAGPGPGGAENHVNYWQVQNGTTSVRETQAGANTTVLATGPATTDGWLLIQRVDSTNFYFFEKAATNALWTLTTNVVLTAAANNAPMEVGPAQQSTTGVNGISTFDTFMLDAQGITSATPTPPAATNFTMTLNTSDLSMTLNWVAADGSGNPVSSIAVMRRGAPVSAHPPVGASLTGDSTFGQGTDLGGGNYVVFVSANPPDSTNNTVTVTGLAPGVTYYADVYTFAGTDGGTIFSPIGATNTLVDGTLTGIAASLAGGIPEGGIGQLLVEAIYTGGIFVPVSSSATVTSDDTNVIKALNGVLTGITNGTANVTAVYGGFTNVTSVTVRPPTFTDEFNTSHDYLNNGVAGSGWDGFYNPNPTTNPVPGSIYVPLANSGASVVDADITSNDMLTISSAGDGWENGNSGGAFLFKYVPGDFQMAVHISSFDIAGYNQPGLLARAYAISNGISGYPLGYVIPNAGGTNDAGEYWVSFTRFDEFGIGTYARLNLDSVVTQSTQPDINDTNYWLLIVRENGTDFDFYKRLNQTDPWIEVPNKTHYSASQFANQPMQVGIMAGPWDGTSGSQYPVEFEHFMLDVSVFHPFITISSSGGNINLSWPTTAGAFTLESTPSLNPANWQSVTATSVTNNGIVTVTIPITGSDAFFRLAQ